ncbi:universal stress protein [Nocardia mexicana]|uniref:Nucleotide-binding universal stress UspA family protein n=1 Tax=Nocardia mexicana TaxID=279262 RepID=A0A370HDG7_9NOCA|nr:universal stress protein [Nocardia mexicana]RDI55281.1 nucleotide-binding universal stress UspA family protein [Nocardia mexicana]
MTETRTRATIVVGADGSEIALQAVVWAAVEAALHRCALHIITSFGVDPRPGMASILAANEQQWLREDGERVLAEAASIARHAVPDTEVVITTELTFDLIIPTLLERSMEARMIVVGSRGRGAIRRALLGSVSTAVSRHAHCPVAVVHGDAAADAAWGRKPVVVGVDGTANSVPAIELAFGEASQRKVGLVAVHAWSDMSGYDMPIVGWEGIRETEQVLLAESLAGWTERFPDVAVERVVVCDSPTRALLARSEEAQLLIVGSHGRGGFPGMVLGSTSTALLHLAHCPTLVVPSSATHTAPAARAASA